MKALNTMKYVVAMTTDITTKYQPAIKCAETFDDAKNAARKMQGYIDCGITFLNTMICVDNNDFTGEFDEVIEDWLCTMYQMLADKASETKQDDDVVFAILKKRDEHRA